MSNTHCACCTVCGRVRSSRVLRRPESLLAYAALSSTCLYSLSSTQVAVVVAVADIEYTCNGGGGDGVTAAVILPPHPDTSRKIAVVGVHRCGLSGQDRVCAFLMRGIVDAWAQTLISCYSRNSRGRQEHDMTMGLASGTDYTKAVRARSSNSDCYVPRMPVGMIRKTEHTVHTSSITSPERR